MCKVLQIGHSCFYRLRNRYIDAVQVGQALLIASSLHKGRAGASCWSLMCGQLVSLLVSLALEVRFAGKA